MTDYDIALNYLSQHYPQRLNADEFAAADKFSAIAEEIWVTQQLDSEQVVDACFDYFSEKWGVITPLKHNIILLCAINENVVR